MVGMSFFNIMLFIKQNSITLEIVLCSDIIFLKWIVVYKWNKCHDIASIVQLNLKVSMNVYQGV